MKLIVNIYDHSEVIHVKFYRGVVSYSRVIALLIPLIAMIFRRQPLVSHN